MVCIIGWVLIFSCPFLFGEKNKNQFQNWQSHFGNHYLIFHELTHISTFQIIIELNIHAQSFTSTCSKSANSDIFLMNLCNYINAL